MITSLINYKPKGLTKEEIIAEFQNLMSWEQIEVLDELSFLLRKEKVSLKKYSNQELKDELESRKVWEGE